MPRLREQISEQQMSIIDASPEHAPSKPPPGNEAALVRLGPMELALMAQKAINGHHIKAGVEGNLIRQLMIGRHVRHRVSEDIWLVKEVRIGLSGKAVLYGRRRGGARTLAIGALVEVDVHQTGETVGDPE